jgi:hypothetical protein
MPQGFLDMNSSAQVCIFFSFTQSLTLSHPNMYH